MSRTSNPVVGDPVVGWRDWRVTVRHGLIVLTGVWHTAYWPRRRRAVARCYALTDGVNRKQRRPHMPPAPWDLAGSCVDGMGGRQCGLYAMRTLGLLEAERGPWPTGVVARGTVSLWGVVEQHTAGYRAQYGYPLEITELLVSTIPPMAPERLVMLIEDGYGIPVGQVREAIGEPREK